MAERPIDGREDPDAEVEDDGAFRGDRLTWRVTAPSELADERNRRRWKLGDSETDRGPHIVELNVLHMEGLAGAAAAFLDLFTRAFEGSDHPAGPPPMPVKISKAYFRCQVNVPEWRQLIAADEQQAEQQASKESQEQAKREGKTLDDDESLVEDAPYRLIYKLWPDFPIISHITRSIPTVKADAALRSFDATGDGIVWAVVDTGVDANHPHFGAGDDHALNDPRVRKLHRCFAPVGEDGELLPDPDELEAGGAPLSREERDRRVELHRKHAFDDRKGHGTHVAGIIAGRVAEDSRIVVLERKQRIRPGYQNENEPLKETVTHERSVRDRREVDALHGVAPSCRIISLRAVPDDDVPRSSYVVSALEYIREKLNDNPKFLRVHGVNLSVGYEFDAEMFACGQSPLCAEVNRLVQSGVVVVASAGNTGYTTLVVDGDKYTKVGLSSTINDPGNADLAITVGSTHRESPHTFGISYFSSKGPTGDGRLKPDLVAPGERILSCAAGAKKTKAIKLVRRKHKDAQPPLEDPSAAYYVEDSGTSMAAPHVSGAIAAFLSIRREFIGRPQEVKRIFIDSAVPLGRERYFEGSGLLDLMKAIQSV